MVKRNMEEFMSQSEHYLAVLDDLQKQRELHVLKITEIDQAAAALRRLIPAEVQGDFLPVVAPSVEYSTIAQVSDGTFAGMGVRWAILKLLTEMATRPMTTGEIAAALKQGGILSNAASFSGNVSAVLSVMGKQRTEVVAAGSGWVISELGKQVWAHIKAKAEAQQQAQPNDDEEATFSANVQ